MGGAPPEAAAPRREPERLSGGVGAPPLGGGGGAPVAVRPALSLSWSDWERPLRTEPEGDGGALPPGGKLLGKLVPDTWPGIGGGGGGPLLPGPGEIEPVPGPLKRPGRSDPPWPGGVRAPVPVGVPKGVPPNGVLPPRAPSGGRLGMFGCRGPAGGGGRGIPTGSVTPPGPVKPPGGPSGNQLGRAGGGLAGGSAGGPLVGGTFGAVSDIGGLRTGGFRVFSAGASVPPSERRIRLCRKSPPWRPRRISNSRNSTTVVTAQRTTSRTSRHKPTPMPEAIYQCISSIRPNLVLYARATNT